MKTGALIRQAWGSVRPRMRPRLIIVGAQKAGTTTLFDILAQHPRVLAPARKELHFFDRDTEYRKGIRHYRAQFPPIPVRDQGHVTLEATPSYLYLSGTCAPRIARHVPGACCVILLRDPVKRAYSAWNMCRQFNEEPHPMGIPDPRPFSRAVEDELAGRTKHDQHRYLARGHYAAQVKDYMDHVGRTKLMVRSFGLLQRDPAGLVNAICDRLGIQPFDPSHAVFRTRSNARSYPAPLEPGLERELRAHFRPELERLHAVLGEEIDLTEP